MRDLDTEMKAFSYIRLKILNEGSDSTDFYFFIPYDGTTFLYRCELGDNNKAKILSEEEIFGTPDEILQNAREKAKKFREKNYDAGEIIVVQDTTENLFPGTLEDKLITAIVMYGCMRNITADNEPASPK